MPDYRRYGVPGGTYCSPSESLTASREKVDMPIKVIVKKGEDGYFVAHCPSLKSCWSQGTTREEALENIKEAIDLYLEPEASEMTDDETLEVIELII
ncbi:MAG: type II toxin-antitoxin system HicB family antitoxin [Methylococcales bacterium]